MPRVGGSICSPAAKTVQVGQRGFHLDTGATFCAISHAGFVRDKAALLQHGTAELLQMQRPLAINMFANGTTECWQAVAGARIWIENSWHTVDLIVIPGGMGEYLLGQSFMRQYEANLNMQTLMLGLGMSPHRLVNPRSEPLPVWYQNLVC
ncbi:hypothetical protein WJX74_010321 [Apatococcus lobatus]|uniref:Uncharacterized protein n=1 Tax=Apatococcus lobatus TaxID=904363 RepID=A0AAW1QWX4_9CHLO